MALLHLPLSTIDEAQLDRLIKAKAAEARDIEYKRDTYGGSDADHAEWLADISSFANTVGGDLLIGMVASKGVPTVLSPITVAPDDEILRLEQIARSGLQPRIPNLQFKAVPVAGGGHVLLIRIPRSFNPPHRVIRQGKGHNRFWARSSAGKYEPNVDELRTLFTLAPQLADRIRDFRFDRVAQIVAGNAPVQLLDRTCLIMHVVPFAALDPRSLISLEQIERDPSAYPPFGRSAANNWRINFDGILLLSNNDASASAQRAYVQVFRSGIVEAVASRVASGERTNGAPSFLQSIKIEGMLLTNGMRYLKSLQIQGVEPPYVVLISLVGVKGNAIKAGISVDWSDGDDVSVLDRDQLHFTEVILETVPQSVQELGAMVRPLIEQIANASGQARSSSFGPNGEYLHHFAP
ncbi:AlbA family DNA-binding domain-containing protein [Thalassobaculum salexigens]|uniref:AlbA family DNA-binding domain-containing protein n=1 Tax=Thalassobaculum salexigens TaxID=455360 RepID=UPI0005715725|nr:ATP-binding protein [Thalassobaculum salexigens]